jgi:lysozyme
MPHALAIILRGLGVTMLVLALAACARGPGLYGPIQGDNRPHSGVDRARAMPIQGIDVARYQGRIDFNAARGGGVHFVFMKSTEGKDYIDPNF